MGQNASARNRQDANSALVQSSTSHDEPYGRGHDALARELLKVLVPDLLHVMEDLPCFVLLARVFVRVPSELQLAQHSA